VADDETYDDVTYDEFKRAILADYYYFVDSGDAVWRAAGRLIDEVGRAMWKNPDLYVCVITTVGTICLREGFLLDYLEEPVRQLDDITSHLIGDARVCYRDDTATLKALITRTSYDIVAPDFPPDYFV